MLHRLLACFAFLALAASPALAQKGPDGAELTQRTLLADASAVEAGKPFYAGFHFQIADHWHTYWQFGGTPFFAFTAKWTLPDGWKAGPVEFPLPEPITVAKPTLLTLFGYEHEVVFFVKLTPPAQLPAGRSKLTAAVRWQVCEELCIQGRDTLTLNLPAGPAQPANAELFAKWKAQLPRTTPPPTQGMKFQAEGNKLIARIGGLPPEAKVDFFPLPPAGFFGTFELGTKPGLETVNGVRVFSYLFDTEVKTEGWSGLLVVQRGDGPREGWMLGGAAAEAIPKTPEVTPPAPAPVTPKPETSAPVPLPNEPAPVAPAPSAASAGANWDPFAELAARTGHASLWTLLLKGFLGGILLNLMPCVLPVISLKIFGFVKQAGTDQDRIFQLGLAFCAGVFTFFMLLATLVVTLAAAGKSFGWGAQFSNPLLLAGMLGIVFLFGLSLLGVFEITLGGAESKLSALSAREGAGGAFVHGFFTTLLGTSCTAPLVGPVIGAAITQPGPQVFALFAAIAAGLALPYFLLTWKPAWMKYLPKPGLWMVRFKQLLGFVMLALVVWLLRSLNDTEAVVRVCSFLLALAFGAWVIGSYHGRGWALVLAAAVAVGAWFLFVQGKITAQPAAPAVAQTSAAGLKWEPFSRARIREALTAGQPVFIDFTATWCLNCGFYEATAINTAATIAEMKAKNVVTIRADYTQEPEDIASALKSMDRAGVPVYVLFRKRGDAWIADGLTQGSLLEQLQRL